MLIPCWSKLRVCCAGLALGLAAGAGAAAPSLDDQVLDTARQALLNEAERQQLLAPDVHLSPPAARPRGSMPACAGDWQIEALDLRQLNRLRLQARCPGGAVPSQEFVLRGQFSAEVLVAAVALPSGRPIEAADVELQRRDLTTLADAVSELGAVQGMSPRSSLRVGQPLSRRQLQASVLVRRGERVRITANNGGIEVQAAGEALDPGTRGALIKVRNSASGRVITARVLSAGVVEPADLPGR